eukprot:scaffold222_cov469-Pavlova_lutheri.AAC.2
MGEDEAVDPINPPFHDWECRPRPFQIHATAPRFQPVSIPRGEVAPAGPKGRLPARFRETCPGCSRRARGTWIRIPVDRC